MLHGQIDRFIENAALNGGDLCLLVGIAHIKMNVRNEEERPLFLRLNCQPKMCGMPVEIYGEAGWCICWNRQRKA
jgi:hypothetical protein